MGFKVDNAIILAAGTASRFAPLSYERHKSLTVVKGEILIERQIKQLQMAGIPEIYIVVGYKKEQFGYLTEKYGVKLIENKEYLSRNNNGSIYTVKDIIKNSYICSSDNYFAKNPFENEVEDAYYSAIYSIGYTNEWCLKEDEKGYITDVKIGGSNTWYMLGHVFWTQEFSSKFIEILLDIYDRPETKDMLWENIYINHINELKLKIRKYPSNMIFEFDTLDELRKFDYSYINNTSSKILKEIAIKIGCKENQMYNFTTIKSDSNEAVGFNFIVNDSLYKYDYKEKNLEKLK